MARATVIANFGGPRSLKEIEPFLQTLLTDRDVVRSRLPKAFFRKIASKRAVKIAGDYASIGGKSPIYEDTEWVAAELRKILDEPVLTFHRYLPATHDAFLEAAAPYETLRFFPMFPQFTYATTGSIARWMGKRLKRKTLEWVKSYPTHPAFLDAFEAAIREALPSEEVFLLFSAHGVPQKFVDTGDIYQEECERSYEALAERFPKAEHMLAYQSKFGPGEWLKPSTLEASQTLSTEKKDIVFVPLTFTSDHIETLFEIETDYMPVIRDRGFNAHRIPALNRRPDWIQAIATILSTTEQCPNAELIRRK